MKPIFLLAGLVLAAGLAACGGGGGGSTGGTQYDIVYPPQVQATPTPFLQSNSAPLATATAMPLPTAAGYSGSVTFPAGSTAAAGTTVQISIAGALPAGISPLSIRRTASSGAAALLYLGIESSADVNVAAGTMLTFNVPSNVVSGTPQLYLGCYDPNAQVWNVCAGPQTLASGSVTFTISSAFTMTANTQQWLALETDSGSGTIIVQSEERR